MSHDLHEWRHLFRIHLDQLTGWRKMMQVNNLDSSQHHFFESNDLCPACFGLGWLGQGHIRRDKKIVGLACQDICDECHGAGTYHAFAAQYDDPDKVIEL